MKKSSDQFILKALLKSFRYAFNGILLVARDEQNMWIHITIALVVIFFGVIFQINRTEWIIIVLCIGFVLVTEMVNTAIEEFVDLLSPAENEKAGRIKDIGAGTVFIAAITSVIIGLLIFVPYLI